MESNACDVQKPHCGIQTKGGRETQVWIVCVMLDVLGVAYTKSDQVQTTNKQREQKGGLAGKKERNKVGEVGNFPVNLSHVS